MTVHFCTPGLIDLRAFKTFGVSSKVGDNPIGYFGTGLKYAIAVLLRTGHVVTMYRDGVKHEFTTQRDTFRNDEFEFVTLNGEQLGFTTDYGRDWQPWMAFRELHSNTLDEQGYTTNDPTLAKGNLPSGWTEIAVRGTEIEACYANRHVTFLGPATKALCQDKYVQICPHNRQPYIYYRGVRAFQADDDLPLGYTYNFIDQMKLTEDRQLAETYNIRARIVQAVMESVDADFIVNFLTRGPHTFEHHWLDFNRIWAPSSPVFDDTILRLARAQQAGLNPSVFSLAKARFAELSAPETAELDSIDKTRLKQAVVFWGKLGIHVDTYPIKAMAANDDSLLGLAHNGTIYLNKKVFSMGTKMVAGTLLEEYIHLKYRLADNTRELQNHLVDQVVSMGERVLKRPL